MYIYIDIYSCLLARSAYYYARIIYELVEYYYPYCSINTTMHIYIFMLDCSYCILSLK